MLENEITKNTMENLHRKVPCQYQTQKLKHIKRMQLFQFQLICNDLINYIVFNIFIYPNLYDLEEIRNNYIGQVTECNSKNCFISIFKYGALV